MKTDDLIKGLVANLKPVKPQDRPSLLTFKFSLFLFSIIFVGVTFMQLRADIKDEITHLLFSLDFICNATLLLSGLFLVSWSSSPGRKIKRIPRLFIFTLIFFIIALNLYRLSISPTLSADRADLKCFLIVMSFASTSLFTICFVISKRIVLSPQLIGTLIGVVAFSVGALTINLHCPSNEYSHIAIYHGLLPMGLGALLGNVCGKLFLKF